MSFGFSNDVMEIDTVIREMEILRNDAVLFFAAASNFGGNQRELFPARHPSVISIRQTNSEGSFTSASSPPDQNGLAVFGTLGTEVPSVWLSSTHEDEVYKSGSSVATPIAAGIAAMILSYLNIGLHETGADPPSVVKKLWTRRGMLAMFKKLSLNMGNNCWFISPERFFIERDSVGRWAAIIDCCYEG
jgi:hypothetical protein